MKENKTEDEIILQRKEKELIDKLYKLQKAESELQQTLSQREKESYINLQLENIGLIIFE